MTILAIDGENFKGKIEDVFEASGITRPAWHEYDYYGLVAKVLAGIPIDRRLFYFARIKEHTETRDKSRQLIGEQRLLKTSLERQGFEVVLSGRVRGQEQVISGKKVIVFREKGVDVRIAVDMVSWTCDRLAERIVLGSSDSDLQPAIAEVRKRGGEVVYLGFEDQPNKGLTYTTNRSILIRNAEVLEHRGKGTLFNLAA